MRFGVRAGQLEVRCNVIAGDGAIADGSASGVPIVQPRCVKISLPEAIGSFRWICDARTRIRIMCTGFTAAVWNIDNVMYSVNVDTLLAAKWS